MRVLFGLILLALSAPLLAQNSLEHGDITIYYNALPSAQLTPDVARGYSITRSANRAMLNISVHRRQPDGSQTAIPAVVHAAATNPNGQRQELAPRKVQEGEAIYYLAEARITPTDTLLFEFDVTPEGASEPIHGRFQQEFFPEGK